MELHQYLGLRRGPLNLLEIDAYVGQFGGLDSVSVKIIWGTTHFKLDFKMFPFKT